MKVELTIFKLMWYFQPKQRQQIHSVFLMVGVLDKLDGEVMLVSLRQVPTCKKNKTVASACRKYRFNYHTGNINLFMNVTIN